MKSAIISLHGFAGIDIPVSIKTVQYSDEKQLITHLRHLQKGYHEKGDGSPKIEKHQIHKDSKNRQIIDCYSLHTDWHYVALIGYKLKADSGKPTEILK